MKSFIGQLSVVLLALIMALLNPAVATAQSTTPATHLANSVDLRPKFTQWNLPIRSQGSRGTCSVFTMTGAIEYALASEHGAGTVLSPEFLNWAANQARPDQRDGGFFSELWNGFETHGICAETNLPYRAEYDPQLKPGSNIQNLADTATNAHLHLDWIKRWDVTTGLTDTEFQAIKHTLATGWPVCGGFRWPKQAQWQNRILQMAAPADVFDGHSVLLVGYRDDDAQPGGGIFLIRNTGGDPHDAALPYAYARAYLNDAVTIHPESTTLANKSSK